MSARQTSRVLDSGCHEQSGILDEVYWSDSHSFQGKVRNPYSIFALNRLGEIELFPPS
jgi:hypothetical protein